MNYLLEAPIIGAIIGAILGTFFAAWFKEAFSDMFYVRKRKREIRASVAKDVVTFFYALLQEVDITNLVEILQRQKKLLGLLRDEAIEDPSRMEYPPQAYIDEMIRINELSNGEVDRANKVHGEVSLIEGNIYALLMEAAQYFGKRKKILIKIFLKKLREQRFTSKMVVQMYEGVDLRELREFREGKLPVLVAELRSRKLQVMDEMIEEVEILLR
jgi:hypothetical protein